MKASSSQQTNSGIISQYKYYTHSSQNCEKKERNAKGAISATYDMLEGMPSYKVYEENGDLG
jgi:hypothetical protein